MNRFVYEMHTHLIESMDLSQEWRVPDTYLYLEPYDSTRKRETWYRWMELRRTTSQAQRDRDGIKAPVFFSPKSLSNLLHAALEPLVGMPNDEIGQLQMTQAVQGVLQHLRELRCDIFVWINHEGVPGIIDNTQPYITSDGVIKLSPLLYRSEWNENLPT